MCIIVHIKTFTFFSCCCERKWASQNERTRERERDEIYDGKSISFFLLHSFAFNVFTIEMIFYICIYFGSSLLINFS